MTRARLYPLACYLVFSPAIAIASGTDFIEMQPAKFDGVDKDGKISLAVSSGLSNTAIQDCPFGLTGGLAGSISLKGVNTLKISLTIPGPNGILKTVDEKGNPPKAANVQIVFEDSECTDDNIPIEFGVGEFDETKFNVTKTREFGDKSLTVVSNGGRTQIKVSSCKLEVFLSLEFTGCQNWSAGEGPVFELDVPIEDYCIEGEKYVFNPCTAWIDFEYDSVGRTRNLEDTTVTAIDYVENCPFNKTRFDEGLCQRCLEEVSPTSQPTPQPTPIPASVSGEPSSVAIAGVVLGAISTIFALELWP